MDLTQLTGRRSLSRRLARQLRQSPDQPSGPRHDPRVPRARHPDGIQRCPQGGRSRKRKPDFFINHYDVSRAAETPVAPGPTGLPTRIDTTTRLAAVPVVTTAKIRGRNRGGGSEAGLAFDLRFASIEKAVFGQPEVGAGMFPGGGALERLPLFVGRARALEIILGSDDLDAETAALYGWINRALPDAELDDFVDNLARRIASFDKPAVAEAKRLVNRRTKPPAEDLVETQGAFLAAFAWPSLRERGARLRKRAGEVGPDFELRSGTTWQTSPTCDSPRKSNPASLRASTTREYGDTVTEPSSSFSLYTPPPLRVRARRVSVLRG